MQFSVPQFIEVEDKIIGPLTLKQFLYLAGGAGLIFLLWYILKLWLFLIVSVPILSLSISLAFLKINGRPFFDFLVSMINYLLKPKTYIWKEKNG